MDQEIPVELNPVEVNNESVRMWHNLPRPIIGLAPMDGVSDQPFRYIQKKYGNPMVVMTEFTSVEGVCMRNLRPMLC